jgi:catechol 2,3-dioxygenase-like lactoylglutathione lyase family enzyme
MNITIAQALLPHDDPAATLAFYRDTLGFEVRNEHTFRDPAGNLIRIQELA